MRTTAREPLVPVSELERMLEFIDDDGDWHSWGRQQTGSRRYPLAQALERVVAEQRAADGHADTEMLRALCLYAIGRAGYHHPGTGIAASDIDDARDAYLRECSAVPEPYGTVAQDARAQALHDALKPEPDGADATVIEGGSGQRWFVFRPYTWHSVPIDHKVMWRPDVVAAVFGQTPGWGHVPPYFSPVVADMVLGWQAGAYRAAGHHDAAELVQRARRLLATVEHRHGVMASGSLNDSALGQALTALLAAHAILPPSQLLAAAAG